MLRPHYKAWTGRGLGGGSGRGEGGGEGEKTAVLGVLAVLGGVTCTVLGKDYAGPGYWGYSWAAVMWGRKAASTCRPFIKLV